MNPIRPVLFWCCVLWTALVWVVLGWQAITYSGLYRWLSEWQMMQFGYYSRDLTLLAVGLGLTALPLHWLGVNERFQQRREDAVYDPASRTVRARRFSLWMAGIAGVIAVVSWGRLQGMPSLTAPPQEVDLVQLGTSEPPLGNAIVHGQVETERSVVHRKTSKYHSMETEYFPIQPKGAKGTPIRFVVSRSISGYSAQMPTATHVFMEDQLKGALVRDGLPGPVMAEFRKQGFQLASPHYLLTSAADGGREPYYVAIVVSSAFGILFLLCAVLQTRIIANHRNHPIVPMASYNFVL